MKIDRLLGIVMILLQKEKVTAPYLAEKFEVSRRTINRDIEDLCLAGIPVVTMQGGKGGISISEGYKIDKSLLTFDELQSIMAGLKGIDSVALKEQTEPLFNKLAKQPNSMVSFPNSMLIDLSSHYKAGLTEKITLLKEAIQNHTLVSFCYYSKQGDSRRLIEPYFIAFQWSSWYIYGYCRERKDFRMFKLNRLWELEDTKDQFIMRPIPEERKEFNRYFTDDIEVTLLFDPSIKYRLIEEYGVGCFRVTDEGKLLFHQGFTDKEYMLSWILGFGSKVEILEPISLREEIIHIATDIITNHKK